MKIIIDVPCVMNLEGDVGSAKKIYVKQFAKAIKEYIDSDEGFTKVRTKNGLIIDASYKISVEE